MQVPLTESLAGRVVAVDVMRGGLAVRIGKDAQVAFLLNGRTLISKDGTSARIYAIAPGDLVRVQFSLDRSGALVARTIAVSKKGTEDEPTFADISQVACTGDIAFGRGHFHPNKAPGASLAAVPAYFLIYNLERLVGVDPDDWWIFTVNAWLSSVFSVGLISALGSVLFFRLALGLTAGRVGASLLSAFAFALGTMFLAYGTMLYEHNLIGVALLAAFYHLHKVKEGSLPGRSDPRSTERAARIGLFLGGLCAGYATITNYIIVVPTALLACYLLLAVRRRGTWLWFGLGLLGPFLTICAYNIACFGEVFTTNYRHQNPIFAAAGPALLGVFAWPQWGVLIAVLFSPFRGLFFGAPMLAMGVVGLVAMFRETRLRAESWLFASILAFFLLFNASFNGWYGGWTTVPRYLDPALPFLALPMAIGFTRYLRTSCVLVVGSIAISLLTTAVDPQSPAGVGGFAIIQGRPNIVERPLAGSFAYNPLTEYELPLFVQGRARPLIDAQRDGVLEDYDRRMRTEMVPRVDRERRLEAQRAAIEAAVRAGDPAPLLSAGNGPGDSGEPAGRSTMTLSDLPTITGPVSANPIGLYEGWMHEIYPPHSPQSDWNSFNLGEFFFPRRRLSLLPLLVGCGLFFAGALRLARRVEPATESGRVWGVPGQRK